ncbi:hypothetical protein [Burkholderia sp. AU6039]|uniref:hypothetical protein n=1 Tax=Burkholderia sp. AU6039 TaxID=2015344 RepID=UPI000B79F249|nr:hypothetical protein [Burkholderia sp. AU6039]OXJ20286.1 hypothetical protein CFB39_10125 [Burkholderia sp. AU6039]
MDTTKTGGPAFPIADPFALRPRYEKELERIASGMTLRDYFAAKAMQGIRANPDLSGWDCDAVVFRAYELADAMLRARGEA